MTHKTTSTYRGGWSDAALVVDGIANGNAAKLLIVHYGFKSDEEWAKAMRKEFSELLRTIAEMGPTK